MLLKIELRKSNGELIFATYGLPPKAARELALEFKFKWPLDIVVITDHDNIPLEVL